MVEERWLAAALEEVRNARLLNQGLLENAEVVFENAQAVRDDLKDRAEQLDKLEDVLKDLSRPTIETRIPL